VHPTSLDGHWSKPPAGITHRQAPRACSIITASSPSGELYYAARHHSSPPSGAPLASLGVTLVVSPLLVFETLE